MRAASAAQMRAIDAAAVARDGETTLMWRAGAAIAALVPRYARPGPIVAIAGNGNNGGDAFSALAALDTSRERIVYTAHVDPHGSDARTDAHERARAAGVEICPFPLDPSVLAGAGLILDGIYGVNARLPLDPDAAASADAMNASGAPILALDVPTGLDATTGAVDAACVRATATIALGAPKLGAFLEPGRGFVGELWVDALGMDDADVFVLDDDRFAQLLPRRAGEAEKRSSGAPLIIAGSPQYPGAGVLCSRGAARAGAGYVTTAVPPDAVATLHAHLIEQVVVTYDDTAPDAAVATLLEHAARCGSIALGPGLAMNDAMAQIVCGVVDGTDLPVVADATALAYLAPHFARWRDKRLVLTPHAGEFARIDGGGTLAPHDRLPRLRAFVARFGITTLLKGRTTLIADHHAVHLNPTGTPALATAGTGDVLTGIIATLLAQGLSPLDAARAGAYWHGRAGQVAAAARPVGVVAGDVAEALADATRIEPHAGGPIRLF
jgi:hydroxyethylthiazole kinase-like uncharacterized protein yjeF